MKTIQESTAGEWTRRPSTSAIGRVYRRLLLSRLRKLTTGVVTLHEGPARIELGRADEAGLHCDLVVQDARFYRDVVRGGSIGAAESYVRDRWSADDLTMLIRILARDARVNQDLEGGAARTKLFLERIRHALRRNSRSGSRRNIAGHYDLGNDFFATFLDPTMTYSCGVFAGENDTMEQASIRKYDLICRKLQLGPEHEVLEIGSGWGGFAIHAAREYGCRVVTTTISRRQRDLARTRIREAGIEDRVELLLEDYRDLPSRLDRRFDRLVSIEMIEAVGHRNLDDYFRVCASMLEPEGSMLLQAIVIADRQYDDYRRSVDFIQRYIFPGGCLPSVTAMCDATTRSGDLRVVNLQDITGHYPRTLRHWRKAFLHNADELEAQGFDERFRRLWEFYFGYCEAGFVERTIGTVQMLLSRPAASNPGFVPQV
jgi:cyclopropane-fatty-acyl-phospholipid synthase